ncbi:MAG: endolytic transglycosylase MltG [Lewinellaceae bacterium]|nr:endolytic transglycosylase MltG [Lewinellaceae bacterium]
MRAIHVISGVSALVLLIIGAIIYFKFVGAPAVPHGLKDYYVQVPTNSSYEEVLDILEAKGILKDRQAFTLLAERMKYKRNPMRAGRYELQPGWSLIQLIRHLRGGRQAPVDVVLTNERLPENVAAKAARFIEPDSTDIQALFQDEDYLASIGYTPETLMSMFIPNTYEFFWNTSPRGFVERMAKEHDAFWEKDNRLQKAEALGLKPQEVYTLASIVEKETLVNKEKPRMAGVYLNRLRTGMRLQADPTAVFARRDFDTPRVTHYHTKFDSPYNTYLYAGLPPGPISMASISSIDAVLNAEEHDYIFFCAKGDGSGLHAFAKTLGGHNDNVAEYKRNLTKRGLR